MPNYGTRLMSFLLAISSAFASSSSSVAAAASLSSTIKVSRASCFCSNRGVTNRVLPRRSSLRIPKSLSLRSPTLHSAPVIHFDGHRIPPPTRAFSTGEFLSERRRTTTRLCQTHVDLQCSAFAPAEEGENEPVVILHGLLGNRRNFASIASSLTVQLSKPRRIVTVDLRNHGENSHDFRETMTYSEMARDVMAVVDRVAGPTGRAVLVGHSMGGKVAQALALMHPERVAGLIVLDIAPVRYCPEGDASWKTVSEIVGSLAELDLEREDLRTKRDVDVALRPVLADPALRAFVLTNLDQQRGGEGESPSSSAPLRWKINMEAIANQIEVLAGFDVQDRDMTTSSSSGVKQYHGDVFYIHGGASRFVRHAHMDTIASFFPNHMLTTIRGAGHWVHAEAPDDTVALLKKYLDR